MTRIRGKFAPMMEELAEDPRWLMECNDLEKFLYMLILFTIYTTNGTAPDDPSYYRVRYNLVHRKHTLSTALVHIKERFPKLLCTNKKLSLLNSTIYKNRVDTSCPREEEVEEDIDTHAQDSLLGFDLFWDAFPKKVGRGAAEKSWAKIKVDDRLLEEILKSVCSAKETEQWKKENGKYIPHPTTWLNQKRWLDVHEPVKKGYDIWKTKPVVIPQ